MLTGLRGVGKTVLLNQLRSAAISRGWGTGKIEARPEQSLRRPVSSALHMAMRELGPAAPRPESIEEVLGVLKAFALRIRRPDAKVRDRWQPGIDVPAVTGRADSGDIEIDLVELFTDVAGLAADVGTGVALFIDEMQDLRPDDVSAFCAACHELSQPGAPLVVVGAGLPHLPAVLSAREVLLGAAVPLPAHRPARPDAADRALLAPAEREDVEFDPEALDALYDAAGGYPYFVQAYGKAPGTSRRLPDHRGRRRGGGAGSRGRARRGLLRLPVRAGDAGRAGVHAGDGRARRPGGDGGAHLGDRRPAGPQARVTVPGPDPSSRRASSTPGSGDDRLHGAALRPLPAPPRGLSQVRDTP